MIFSTFVVKSKQLSVHPRYSLHYQQFKKMVQQELLENGFALVENLFTENEIKLILQIIENQQNTNAAFKTNGDLFAIRCFLQQFSELQMILMNDSLKTLLASLGADYKMVKSIYFDKPIRANWVVNWHQDLTISVQNKVETNGFTLWLPKQNYFSVQPTIEYLENMVTIRIHLDDCTQQNGALRVIPKSHQTIQAIQNLPNPFFEDEQICEVAKGGALIMKPLIWHSSKRTENQQKRRVIHLEFSNLELPKPLIWAETIF